MFLCLDRLINRLSNLSLTIELIDDLFHYASSNWSSESFNCIHELILKQHLPRQLDAVLHSTLRRSVQLLALINEHPSMIPNREKITEILRSIFSLHWKRCESMEQFPLMELLTGLYKFTLDQVRQQFPCRNIDDCLHFSDESRWILRVFGYLVDFHRWN